MLCIKISSRRSKSKVIAQHTGRSSSTVGRSSTDLFLICRYIISSSFAFRLVECEIIEKTATTTTISKALFNDDQYVRNLYQNQKLRHFSKTLFLMIDHCVIYLGLLGFSSRFIWLSDDGRSQGERS